MAPALISIFQFFFLAESQLWLKLFAGHWFEWTGNNGPEGTPTETLIWFDLFIIWLLDEILINLNDERR